MSKKRFFVVLVSICFYSSIAFAQEPAEQPGVEEDCFKPSPLLDVNDFPGPIKKVAAFASRKLERKTVHPPHHLSGATLCAMDPSERFALFWTDWSDPVSFAGTALHSGWQQFRNQKPQLGQGTEGFAKRYGIIATDKLTREFFTTFLYPSVFHEDPRYYRMAHGPVENRLAHAVSHIFVAHRNSGREMFNFSEWAGLATYVSLRRAYDPTAGHGFQAVLRQVGFGVATDIGSDTFREFWPEISQKLKIPFISRDHTHRPKSQSN